MMFITSRFAGALAALVDDGEIGAEPLGERTRAHHAADVGRHDHQIAAGPDNPWMSFTITGMA